MLKTEDWCALLKRIACTEVKLGCRVTQNTKDWCGMPAQRV